MRIKHAVAIAIFCVVGAASAFAQSVPPPPLPPAPAQSAKSGPQAPPVRVATRIVQVNVIVQDNNGRPVTGLTKDDFALLDQGRRQQIASVSEQTSRVIANAAVHPNLFTNRFPETAGAQPPLTVVVLDAYTSRFFDMQTCPCGHPQLPYMSCFNSVGDIFNQVQKFIRQMQPQDRVALYELVDKLYLLQDFTSDPDALQRGVDRGKNYVAGFKISRAESDPHDMDAHTMDAMHAIGDRLAKVPGRKNLIWLAADGFPPLRFITDDKIDQTSKTLGNADLPLSAIDARGMYATCYSPGCAPASGPGSAGGGGGGGLSSGVDLPTPALLDGNFGGDVCRSGHVPQLHDFDYSHELADLTGGRTFENTNDFAGAIRRVIDDSSSTYLLSYYPDHNKWNGQFREIKVKVDRPGVQVHYRRGYFAVADTASASQKEAEKLTDAMRGPIESTDLGFDVQADATDVAGARQLKVKITLDANQLRFAQQGNRWTDNITEYWAQFNSEGQQVSTHSQTINLKPSPEAHTQLLQHGLSFSETVSIEKNAAEVRLVLRDVGNGAIGSVIIPLSRLFPSTLVQPEPKK